MPRWLKLLLLPWWVLWRCVVDKVGLEAALLEATELPEDHPVEQVVVFILVLFTSLYWLPIQGLYFDGFIVFLFIVAVGVCVLILFGVALFSLLLRKLFPNVGGVFGFRILLATSVGVSFFVGLVINNIKEALLFSGIYVGVIAVPYLFLAYLGGLARFLANRFAQNEETDLALHREIKKILWVAPWFWIWFPLKPLGVGVMVLLWWHRRVAFEKQAGLGPAQSLETLCLLWLVPLAPAAVLLWLGRVMTALGAQ